jgi:hypothetical protein
MDLLKIPAVKIVALLELKGAMNVPCAVELVLTLEETAQVLQADQHCRVSGYSSHRSLCQAVQLLR